MEIHPSIRIYPQVGTLTGIIAHRDPGEFVTCGKKKLRSGVDVDYINGGGCQTDPSVVGSEVVASGTGFIPAMSPDGISDGQAVGDIGITFRSPPPESNGSLGRQFAQGAVVDDHGIGLHPRDQEITAPGEGGIAKGNVTHGNPIIGVGANHGIIPDAVDHAVVHAELLDHSRGRTAKTGHTSEIGNATSFKVDFSDIEGIRNVGIKDVPGIKCP
jgi:hypothetical protein